MGTGAGSDPLGGGAPILRGRAAPSSDHLLTTECTFEPLLCAKSLALAAAREARCAAVGPREVHLMQYKAGVEARCRQLRLARDAEELQECTFKPVINGAASVGGGGGIGGGTGGGGVYMPNYSAMLNAARGEGGGSPQGNGGGTAGLRSTAEAAAASATAASLSGTRHEWLYHLASLKNAALAEAAQLAAAARRSAEEEECTFRPAGRTALPGSSSASSTAAAVAATTATAAAAAVAPVQGVKGHYERAAKARADKEEKANAIAMLSLGVLNKGGVVRDARGLTVTKPFKMASSMRAAAAAGGATTASSFGGGGTSSSVSGGGSGFLTRPEDLSGSLYDPVSLPAPEAAASRAPPPSVKRGGAAGGGGGGGSLADTAPPAAAATPSQQQQQQLHRSVSFAPPTPAPPAAALSQQPAPQPTPQHSHSASTPLVFSTGEPPLLYVDVTVAAGSVERLPVWRDSDLSALAADFAEKHALPRKMARRLEKLMAEQRDAIVLVGGKD